MKTLCELITGVSSLFALGVAGGLEKGYVGIPGALIAWAVSAVVIAVSVLVRKKA